MQYRPTHSTELFHWRETILRVRTHPSGAMNSGIPEKVFVSGSLAIMLALLSAQKTNAISTPFLFFCQHEGASSAADPHFQIHVQLSGNPKFYQSGQIYNGESEVIPTKPKRLVKFIEILAVLLFWGGFATISH